MSVFTYGFPLADQRFEEAGFRSISLCTYTDLLEAALTQGYLTADDISSLEAWRSQPESWTPSSPTS